MRRKVLFWTLAGVSVLAIIGIRQATTGQNAGNGKDQPANPLAIRHVVLFNSGVGYFQREGQVDGNARVDLSFPVGDINDLLKSMILQDLGGGRISSVNYDSHDPIEKTLRSFALDLTTNPTFGQLLNQARGEKIEVLLKDKPDAKPAKLTGVVVGMETQRKQVGKDQVVDIEVLNLSTADGLRSVLLEQVLHVKFLNPVLEDEFQRALKVLASSHDMQKKTVSLGFSGQGKRQVKVGYVVERPIWKTSYRLRIDPNGLISLQGWALVENTSDDDWNDVHMVLVSGRPISYQMNLYEPLYIPRPFVEPEMFASLRPPVYGGSLYADSKQAGAPPAQVGQDALGKGQGQGGQFGQPFLNQAINPNFQNNFGQFGQMGGFGYFNPYQKNSGLNMQNSNIDNNAVNTMNKLTFEELQERRQEQQVVAAQAKKLGSTVAGLNFKEGIASVATSDEVGDYYRYVLDQKINLPRQKSAMLPIIDESIDGSKISIFNEAIHSKYPLLGLRLKNTSGQPLTQGPITVYEEGSYAGDTRILDLQPGEERLLSYALDQSTEVKTTSKSNPSPEMNFKIGAAQLTARYKLQQTRTYTIKNRAAKERLVVIEHPVRTDWKLVDPSKPSEKTRSVYRFRVTVPPGKTVEHEVVEEQARLDQLALSTGQDGKPLYAVTLGIEVKPVSHTFAEKLTNLKIQKGIVIPTQKVRESNTYFLQNLSEEKRIFTVDHVVRQDWVRLDADGTLQRGPAVYRFQLEVPAGKTADKEVIEERTIVEKGKNLKELPEAKVKEYIASPVPSAEVKAALLKALNMGLDLSETQRKLAELEKQLKTLSDDQARLRENLKIIPPTSDPYKTFLDKFVTQESEIDQFQKQIRQTQATVQNLQREYDLFVANLNAE